MKKFIILFFSLFILFSCDSAETLYTPTDASSIPYGVYQQIDAFKLDSTATYKFITTNEYEYVITKTKLPLTDPSGIVIHRYFIDYDSLLLVFCLLFMLTFFSLGFAVGKSNN